MHLAETRKDWRCSFLDLCSALTSLSPSELRDVGAFVVVVKPDQLLEIPAGFVFAETPLTASNVTSYFSVIQPDYQPWNTLVSIMEDLVSSDVARNPKGNDDFLKRLSLQLEVLPAFLDWLAGRSRETMAKVDRLLSEPKQSCATEAASVPEPKMLALPDAPRAASGAPILFELLDKPGNIVKEGEHVEPITPLKDSAGSADTVAMQDAAWYYLLGMEGFALAGLNLASS